MGRSPKPLTICVHPDMVSWPEIKELSDKGHTIITGFFPDVVQPDLILAPEAWRMTNQHRKYLPLAIAAARKIRYPKEK